MEFSEEYMYTDGRRHERVFLPTAEQEQHQTQLLSMFPAGKEPYQPHDAVPTQSFQYIREEEHEHLFYKVVTPSDVGKLNRLVIPKQHAERCFPLDPCLRKKGRFLSFQETVTGKIWWFRYSYWNSSQSYVFTKGWIRFVKENKLCAGDIVSFERSLRENFYYISCRKRPRASSSSEMDTLAMATSLEQQRYVWNEEDDGSSSSSQMKMDMNTVHHTPPSSTRLFGVELAAP